MYIAIKLYIQRGDIVIVIVILFELIKYTSLIILTFFICTFGNVSCISFSVRLEDSGLGASAT